jgi:hypothetical protein
VQDLKCYAKIFAAGVIGVLLLACIYGDVIGQEAGSIYRVSHVRIVSDNAKVVELSDVIRITYVDTLLYGEERPSLSSSGSGRFYAGGKPGTPCRIEYHTISIAGGEFCIFESKRFKELIKYGLISELKH